MPVPNGPSVLAPNANAHYAVGSAIQWLITPQHPDGTNVTGYEFQLSESGGTVEWYIHTVTGVNLSSGNNIYFIGTLSEPLPTGISLEVRARTRNAEGWGLWGSGTSIVVTNTAPTFVTGTAAPQGTVNVVGATVTPTFSITVNDTEGDPIKYYEAIVENDGGAAYYWISPLVSIDIAAGSVLTFQGPSNMPNDASYKWKIRAWDAAMRTTVSPSYTSYINFSLVNILSSNTAPTLTSTGGPSGTVAATTNDYYNFTCTSVWTDAEGHSIAAYQLQIENTSDSTTVLDTGKVPTSVASGATLSVTGPALSVGSNYRWRIKVWDVYDAESSWSSYTDFTPAVTSATNLPPTATAITPSGATTSPVSFVGGFSDLGGTLNTFSQYQLRIYEDSTLVWTSPLYNTTATERSAKQFSRLYAGPALSSGSTYYWQCKVWDNGGLGSAWSTLVPFSIQVAPNAPVSLAPSGVTTTLSFSFTGGFSTSGAGTLAYTQIVVKNVSNVVIWDSGAVASSGSTFSIPYAGPALSAGQQITWIARNKDSNGLWGPYSGATSVVYQSTPDVPINLFPASSNVAAYPSTRPVFGGDNSHPSSVGMNAAQIVVYTEDEATQLWDSGIVAQTGTRFKIGYAGTALSDGQVIKWKARTRSSDTNYWGPYTELQTLRINKAPEAIVNPSPNGANISTLTPTLTWTAKVGEATVETSAIANGRRPTFTILNIVDQQTLADVVGYPDNTSAVWDDFSALSGWTTEAGTWAVSAGRLYCSAGADNARLYKDSLISDGLIGCLMKYDSSGSAGSGTVGPGAGIYFRRSDASNYWVVSIAGGTLYLSSNVAGTFTTVASADVDVVHGYDCHISVTLSGQDINVYFNGVEKIDYTDATNFNTTETEHGIFASQSTSSTFDNFFVASSTAGASAYVVGGGDLSSEKSYTWVARIFDGYVLGAYNAPSTFTTVSAPSVAITSHAEGDTIASPNPTITWSYTGYGGRTQTTYRIRILNNATVVYDSGSVSSSGTSASIPTGYLLNGNVYTVIVTVTDTFNLVSNSTPVNIITIWTPPSAIGSITATGDATTASVLLEWERSALTASVFVRYEIYRQIGTDDEVIIAQINDIETLSWTDYFIASGKEITYRIIQYELVGIEAVPSTNVYDNVTVTFRDMWLTDTSDTSVRVRLRDNPSKSFNTKRQEESKLYWGARAPVRHIGQHFYQEFSISFMVFGPNGIDGDEDDTYIIDYLTTMLRNKAVVHYMDGRGRTMFANFTMSVEDQLPDNYQVSLSLEETTYSEV